MPGQLFCMRDKQKGFVSPFQGPSGAGKTSFLTAVAGKETLCTVTGTVLINGREGSIQSYRKIVGFVPQVSGCTERSWVVNLAQRKGQVTWTRFFNRLYLLYDLKLVSDEGRWTKNQTKKAKDADNSAGQARAESLLVISATLLHHAV